MKKILHYFFHLPVALASLPKSLLDYWKSSKQRLPLSEKIERLNCCLKCDQYDSVVEACWQCGCFVEIKSSFASFDCPIKRWPNPSFQWKLFMPTQEKTTSAVPLVASFLIAVFLGFGGGQFAFYQYHKEQIKIEKIEEKKKDEPVKASPPNYKDSFVYLNGKRIDENGSKIVVDLVNKGTGQYVLESAVVNEDKAVYTISVSAGVNPPKPDDVKPQPKPDDVNPPPIPNAGFRVLIVAENNPQTESERMPKEQRAILSSPQVLDYLDANCAMGDDGKTREYRFFDPGQTTENESNIWKLAMQTPRPSLPWCLISNGVKGYNGPLPKTVPEFLALCKKIKE